MLRIKKRNGEEEKVIRMLFSCNVLKNNLHHGLLEYTPINKNLLYDGNVHSMEINVLNRSVNTNLM